MMPVVLTRSTFTPDGATALADEHGSVAPTTDGHWLALGYDACRTVLRDPAFGSAPPAGTGANVVEWSEAAGQEMRFPGWAFYRGVGLEPKTLLTADGDHHRWLRDWLGRGLNGLPLDDIADRAAATARQQCDALLAGTAENVIHDFTEHVPLHVLEMLFGIPASHLETFRIWSHDVSLLIDAPALHSAEARERSRRASMNLIGYLRGLVAHRIRVPKGDLVSRLVNDPSAPGPDDIVGTLMLLLIAGHETTIGMLGNALVLLASSKVLPPGPGPERRGLVNELFRRAGPVQYVARTAVLDASIDDVSVPAGAQVLAMLAAGNHDPRVFPHPHDIDPVNRARRPGLGFGVGAHSCIGAGLARIELDACLEPLMDLASRLDLDGPVFGESLFIRGPVELPVRGGRHGC